MWATAVTYGLPKPVLKLNDKLRAYAIPAIMYALSLNFTRAPRQGAATL